MIVNKSGYVERRTSGTMVGRRGTQTYRDWFLIKSNKYVGKIAIGMISFPKHMVGKRIKIKVEVIEDEGEIL